MNKINKDNFKQDAYKHGFVTEIEDEKIPKGLNEDIIKLISIKKKWTRMDARMETGCLWAIEKYGGS